MPIDQRCEHGTLTFEQSDLGKQCGYKRSTAAQRKEAVRAFGPLHKKQKTTPEGRHSEGPPVSTFPAPLIYYGDELFHDPNYPAQSLQNWIDEEDRNDVTKSRRCVYVVPPPTYSADVDFMREWTRPVDETSTKASKYGTSTSTELPAGRRGRKPDEPMGLDVQEIARYLQAFYHGLPVIPLETPKLEFVSWEDPKRSARPRSTFPKYVGLSIGHEAIGIRCRQPTSQGAFPAQLNLNDVLDCAISILPKDAYALLMLIDQDMYEGQEDDFCCGRAYGGSRVAVVSTARYRPELDNRSSPDHPPFDREHAWPASHCLAHREEVNTAYSSSTTIHTQSKKPATGDSAHSSAMAAAVAAFKTLPPPSTVEALQTLWLGRVCKTASHELGHCFGMDHCVYYACVMQGTANLSEDARQPPHLCPVDLAKMLKATGAREKDRYAALLRYCERWKEDKFFAAFTAWLRVCIDGPQVVLM